MKGDITYRYDWFLNTRTSASLSARTSYQRTDYIHEGDYFSDFNDITCTLDGNLYYYFSPRLKASVGLLCFYKWNDRVHIASNSQFHFGNQIGINYAIF
ncbi:hypothetical protein [Maribellus maritimus]|uniref:hypothetical protein n=1 Tax=Maribellus maritimus TaxID=2870838 RepID=UPI001EEB86DE|nr:hypothetical protein [Maribellus maritimus]MCG6190424.1 hypothetical protein [Maribellus maritimus]